MTNSLAGASMAEKRRLLAELLQKKASQPRSFPLSFAQERIWVLDQLQPGHPVFNLPLSVRMKGPLDVALMERTFSEIVHRHEVLRTGFGTSEGQPVQLIAPQSRVSVPVADLTCLPESERESYAIRLLNRYARLGFDLTSAPLLRPLLLRLGENDHIFLLVIHHIVYDGWSRGILLREISALYTAFAEGKPSPLSDLSIQYADFAVWQRKWLQGAVLEQQTAYWRKQLEGVSTLRLAVDRPRPEVRALNGARERILLSFELSEALRKLSREQGVTLFMTLLAGFKVMLHRFSAQEDIVVGSLIANRNRAEIEPLIGFFTNNLVLRTDVSGNPDFREVLKRVRTTTLGAYAHQDLPFEKLVDELNPERDLSHTPLFQVLFVLQNAPRSEVNLPGLTLIPVAVETEVSQFDLAFDMVELRGQVAGAVDYNTDLFDAGTIQRMIGSYESLLAGAVENPSLRISELPVLTESQRRQLLIDWNDTGKEYSNDACVHTLFEAQAARRPDHVAVKFENQRVTYSELNARAERVALRLKKLGVGPETRVGICVAPSVEMIAALLGVLKAGGAYVPMDPNYPVERVSFMLGDSGVSVVLTELRLAAQFADFRGAVVYLDEARDDSSAADAIHTAPQAATSGNLAYVIYTSGSTGRPKGVMLEHRGVCNLANAQIEAFGITEESRELQFASLSFDASVSEIFTALLAGATLCMASREALMPGKGLSDLMRDDQITTVTLPPTALAILPDSELQNLNTLVVAGEACSAELVRRWSGGRRFLNAYGPTEVTVCATIGECIGGDDKPSIGRPLTNAQVYVLDAHLQPVPIGVTGELYIGGAGVARGYHNLPDMTAERFIPDPFSGRRGSRLFRSGDLVRYLANGELDFIGRADNQVKLRGYRIELGEVEHALAGHTSVREAAVTVRENGAGDVRLVAYVTRADDGMPTPGELRRYLKTKLPAYMLPSDYVVMDGFPLGPSGKVDKLALPVPEALRNDDDHHFVVPQTAMEQTIASVWREVLHIDKVGVEDHFFDVGGHSLLMIQAVGKLQKELSREISVIELFRYPTISSLAKYLTGSEPQESPISSKDRVRARQESSKEQRERRTRHRESARQAVAQPDPEL